jgi:arylsulfatase A-like enzyme
MLESIDYMPIIKDKLGRGGLTLNRLYVPDSLCCPSRSSIFTGMYCSNHKIYENAPPNGGFEKFVALGHDHRSLGPWIKAKGYATALVGKLLNHYYAENTSYVGPGWDEWFAITSDDENSFYDTVYSDNGVEFDAAGTYQTDLIGSRAISFINEHANEPFFLYIAPEAPHSPATPAIRHAHLYPDLKNPIVRAYNESTETMANKPVWIKNLPPIDEAREQAFDERYRNRVLSLLAVDEMVGAIVDRLAELRILDDTYIIYTSDNGFHQGQHRLTNGKRQAYEEDILVPGFIRGPRITPGASTDNMIAMIDITATMLEIAGYRTLPTTVDGVSQLSMLRKCRRGVEDSWRYEDEDKYDEASALHDPKSLRDYMYVLANHSAGGGDTSRRNLYDGVRHVSLGKHAKESNDVLYVEWYNGECEYYDLAFDPFQLYNRCNDTAINSKKRELVGLLSRLRECAGKQCRDLAK